MVEAYLQSTREAAAVDKLNETTPLSAAHAARRDAEARIRKLTDDPRELAAQLCGELVRCGCEPEIAQWARRSARIAIADEDPWLAIQGNPVRMSLGKRSGMLLKGSSVPYDHDAALAHLMGET